MMTWQVLLLLFLLSATVWSASTRLGGRRRLRESSRIGLLGAPRCPCGGGAQVSRYESRWCSNCGFPLP